MTQSTTFVPLQFHINEISAADYEKVVAPSFERIITTRVRSVPIKKEIIANIQKYEGSMFSELCSDALLVDNRIYIRYRTIIIKGFPTLSVNPTLYVFHNDAYDNATNKKDDYIFIEMKAMMLLEKEEPLVNIDQFNKDLLKIMKWIVLGYILLYIYIGIQYIASIK